MATTIAAAEKSARADKSAAAEAKWHPGHYMLVWNDRSGITPRGHFDSIAGTSFEGAQVRYGWRELEPKKGVYNFSRIEADLAYLQKLGKRLVMQIEDRAFGSSRRPLPDYLYDDPQYHGGTEPFKGKSGSVARQWDPVVIAREIALIEALGKRFDKEPYFEAFCFEESAIAVDKKKAEGFSDRKYLDGLKQLIAGAKAAFPHTCVIEYANWLASPPGALAELAEHCYQVGAGWGGPDVIPDGAPGRRKTGRVAGYEFYPKYAGKMPLGAAVQTPEFGGKVGTFTLDELYNMGVNTLKLNYMFWIRVEGPKHSHSFTRDILPYINGKKGRTNSDCPENIR